MIPIFALVALKATPLRPEHPRPDIMRSDWGSLNGTWEFAETMDNGDRAYLGKKAFPDRIDVPFARESKLSGLARTGFVTNVWCRRQLLHSERLGG